MASYLITGTSRGIGLALVEALSKEPTSKISTVFAGYRTKTEAFDRVVAAAAGRIIAIPLDVTSSESINEAYKQVEESLEGKGLDVLINNAGVLPWTEGGIMAMDDLESTFSINVTSTHNVTRAFIPVLEKGSLKKVINVSSTVGAFHFQPRAGHIKAPAYTITKAALNMLTVQWARWFAGKGFTICAISPGWVQTDLGGPYAQLTLEDAIPLILEIVFRNTEEDNGKFLDIVTPGYEPNYAQRILDW